MEENNNINEELKNKLDETVNPVGENNISEYNQQNQILNNNEMEKGKKLVLQRPSITTFKSPNSVFGMNVGRKNNAGFVPMITVAGILALMGIIITYIVFGI